MVYISAAHQLFSIIVFGCISSQGWRLKDGKDVCLYNEDSNACNYGVAIGVIGFLASMAFIAGEYLFEQMSSVKTRKHYVMADLGFSGERCRGNIKLNSFNLTCLLFSSLDVFILHCILLLVETVEQSRRATTGLWC